MNTYTEALSKLTDSYKIAFVVAGTDVLSSDPLGKMGLTLEDVEKRECLTLKTLKKLNIPTVMLTGGGYSKESAQAIAQSILACITQQN